MRATDAFDDPNTLDAPAPNNAAQTPKPQTPSPLPQIPGGISGVQPIGSVSSLPTVPGVTMTSTGAPPTSGALPTTSEPPIGDRPYPTGPIEDAVLPTPTVSPTQPPPAPIMPGDMPADTYSSPAPSADNGFTTSYNAVMAGGTQQGKDLYQFLKESGLGGQDVQYGSDGSVMYGSGPNAGHVIPGYGPNQKLGGLLSDATYGASETGSFNDSAPVDPNPAAKQAAAAAADPRYLQGGLETDGNGNAVAGGYNALSDLYRQLGITPGAVNSQVEDLVKTNPALVDALPADQAATLRAGLGNGSAPMTSTPSGITPPTKANDAGVPSVGNTSISSGPTTSTSTGGTAHGTSGVGAASGPSRPPISTGNPVLDALLHGDRSANAAAKLTPTNPNNPLTAQTISVGDTADPVAQALAAYNTFRQQTDPQYQADLRDATRMAAATGAIGSGQLNTSLGNIANTRQNTLSTKEQELLNNALTTKNDNAYRNVGIAQQQQGFQAGQQDTAFNHALQQALYGSSGDPSQLGLALSAIFGNQATTAGNNLESLINGSSANGQTGNSIQQLLSILTGGGGGGGGTPTDPATQQVLDAILNGGIPGISTIGG